MTIKLKVYALVPQDKTVKWSVVHVYNMQWDQDQNMWERGENTVFSMLQVERKAQRRVHLRLLETKCAIMKEY